jgi:hypothetical protein
MGLFVVGVFFAAKPAIAQGLCGYTCSPQRPLCSDGTSCKTSACIVWVCGALCNDCQSEEAGLCLCPDGTKVYPDTCGSLGNCTTQCEGPLPLWPHGEDWLRERKLFEQAARPHADGGGPLLASGTSSMRSLAP